VNENLGQVAPELILALSAVTGLLAGSWLPRTRQWLVRALAVAACAAGLAAAGLAAAQPAATDFGGSYAVDTATSAVRIIVLAATALVCCTAAGSVAAHPRESEFYVLVQLAALGTIVLAGASDLLLLFAAYLLASVPGYALAGFSKDAPGTEAALKYYLTGALSGVLMLAGITLLDGAGRATGYPLLRAGLAGAPHGTVTAALVAVLAGLLFKAGAVPVHFWLPDVTEGSSPPAAAFLTTVPKIGAFAALLRLLTTAIPPAAVDWPLLAAVLAAATMTLGNLAAFYQTSVKRLLAYSAISQSGYLLMGIAATASSPLAARALLFYLAAYAATNLAAFAVAAELPRAATLASYRGMARRHPGLAAVLVVSLLGLVGTPPTAIFLGKLEVFTAAIDGGYTWLAALAAANTVASLFYYLRWLVPAFSRLPAEPGAADGETAPDDAPAEGADLLRPAGGWAAAAAYAAGGASLALGLAAGAILPPLAGNLLR
jgi:NADH-quinone oxidoreductase subunit N